MTSPVGTALGLARQLIGILHKDEDRLKRIDDYVQGCHDDPYMPANCAEEYRLLAERSISNWTRSMERARQVEDHSGLWCLPWVVQVASRSFHLSLINSG